ncbi:hypothetical protein Forpi1262_v006111 [Fusarium oxysporum f. sp. raphani]|uniref:Uncharacterized protein n=1 Tax=Fusarium oxysporum f. sp. raphani TaxID=96318 RepID=A0A8J5Q0G1_FUSOX|nr:hypothetical protein Forpi1262_v006111 [Fusarium oxysporum f. sp. raphani]
MEPLYKSIAEILFSLRTKVHLKLFSSTPSPHHLGEISFCCTIAQVAFATKLASSPGSEDQARISVVRDIHLRSALHSEQSIT